MERCSGNGPTRPPEIRQTKKKKIQFGQIDNTKL